MIQFHVDLIPKVKKKKKTLSLSALYTSLNCVFFSLRSQINTLELFHLFFYIEATEKKKFLRDLSWREKCSAEGRPDLGIV